MTEPSFRPCDLACERACRDGKFVAEIEQALELHRLRGARYGSAADFYRRLSRDREKDA
jgi:hypothetical protein